MNRVFLLPWLICFAQLALPVQAYAEGPGTGGRAIRLENEPAGPYLLRVVTSPTPPRTGSLFVEVRVIDGATEKLPRCECAGVR